MNYIKMSMNSSNIVPNNPTDSNNEVAVVTQLFKLI